MLEVTRLVTAAAVAETDPSLALKLAPQLPAALTTTAMGEIGRVAAAGGDPSPSTLEKLRLVENLEPLRPEPYLVHAALAQRIGDYGRAEKFLLAARTRDPRSAAARYLLANNWLMQGKVAPALGEMVILGRFFPAMYGPIIKLLSEYARSPGAAAKLAFVVKQNPNLKSPLLKALAENPDNAALLLEMQSVGARLSATESQAWQSTLLRRIVERRQYDEAYALWQQFAGLEGRRQLLFNGGFERSSAPAPFNWTLSNSSAGVAEPGAGGLQVLYYGQQNARLASQTLLLAPGSYKLKANTRGQLPEQSLSWVVSCLESGAQTLELWLTARTAEGRFEVPASGCAAQKLELTGHLQDMPEDADVLIGPVTIERLP
jgi:hypothetical protein